MVAHPIGHKLNFLKALTVASCGTSATNSAGGKKTCKAPLPSRNWIVRIASITFATSTPFGQRVAQVMQATQSQGAWLAKTSFVMPNCRSLMIWCGSKSAAKPNGQPAEHFPH
jgi:hypothetical protein